MIKRITKKIAVLSLSLFLVFNYLPTIPTPSQATTPTTIQTNKPIARKKAAPSKSQTIRKELVKSVDEYINNRTPSSKLTGEAIVRLCEKHNFDICFALAQAEIESHFGTKGVAARTNSPWNIGAWDGRTAQQMKQKGLGYSHPDSSIEPYIIHVKTKYLGQRKTIIDLMNNYVSLKGYRYASNPNYERSLARKYKHISQSTKINKLQSSLRANV